MAQIDPSIALNVKPLQLESPVNQMMAIAQLRGAQQQQQMNALKLQEYQQQEKERNALAQTISRSDFDLNNAAHVQDLLRQAPTLGVPYVKEARMAAAEKARADKEAVQAEHERFKMRKEQLDFTNAALQKSTNPMLARAQIQQAIDLKYVTPEVGVQMLTSVPEDSTEFEAWRSNLLSQSMTAKDQLELTAPKVEKIDLNGVVKHIDLNPRSLTYGREVLPEMAKVVSPAEQQRLDNETARLEEQTRHANAMEEIGRSGVDRARLQLEETQRHNQAMEKLRLREINKPPAGDNPNKVAHTSTDDQGNVTFYNAFGQVIRTEANAGKRSPNVIKAEQAEKNLGRDIERTSKELADIVKDGGLIDQSTGSGFGRAVDVTNRFFGKATEGDIAASSLAPIADMVLKMVPRFEGPQSDKDTASYKEAAGRLADPTLPREIRKEAGKTILRLMKERKDQFAGEGMDASPNQRRAAPPPPANFVLDKK
jgi:hypothetical protein